MNGTEPRLYHVWSGRQTDMHTVGRFCNILHLQELFYKTTVHAYTCMSQKRKYTQNMV